MSKLFENFFSPLYCHQIYCFLVNIFSRISFLSKIDVIHTVGPTNRSEAALVSCYETCLQLVHDYKIRSVVCIKLFLLCLTKFQQSTTVDTSTSQEFRYLISIVWVVQDVTLDPFYGVHLLKSEHLPLQGSKYSAKLYDSIACCTFYRQNYIISVICCFCYVTQWHIGQNKESLSQVQ